MNVRFALGLVCASVVLGAAPGCPGAQDAAAPEGVPTLEGIPLADVSLEVQALSNGEIVLVRVALLVDGARHDLGRGDRLLLRTDGSESVLVQAGEDGHVGRLTTGRADPELALRRDGEEEVVVTLSLPPPFAIILAGVPVTAGGGFALTWEADPDPSHTLQLEVGGPCAAPLVRSLEQDTGTYAVQGGEISVEATTACEGWVSLTRRAPRTELPMGPASWLTSTQVRTAALEFAP